MILYYKFNFLLELNYQKKKNQFYYIAFKYVEFDINAKHNSTTEE